MKNFQIENPGLSISDKDITELEEMAGFPLPSDYREFLRKYNGGQPTPDLVEIDGFEESPTDIQVFFGINRSEKTSNISWNLLELGETLNSIGLPIACDSGGAIFAIKRDQSVLYILPFEDESTIYSVADTFSDFLKKLS